MPPRDPVTGFLGFDPRPAGERELEPLKTARAAPVEVVDPALNAMSTAAAAEARAAGQIDLIVREAGLPAAIAAIDRLRVRAIETARVAGKGGAAGPWIF